MSDMDETIMVPSPTGWKEEEDEETLNQLREAIFPSEPNLAQVWGYAQGTSARANRLERDVSEAERAISGITFLVVGAVLGLILIDRRLRRLEKKL